MKLKRTIPLAVLAFFLAMTATSRAQPGPNWRVYKAADGLPETVVTSIIVGSRGHLWVRHPAVPWIGWLDGYEVKALPSPGLGSSRVYESASGQIWTFTNDGLQRYQSPETGWIQYPTPELAAQLRQDGANPPQPLGICPIKQNRVLILTPGGLLECNTDHPKVPVTMLLRSAKQSGLQQFSSMAPARDGGLWITGANGLAKVPGPIRNVKADAEWLEYSLPGQLQIHNLREPSEGDDGRLIALAASADGARQMLAGFDGRQWSLLPLPGEKIMRVWRTIDGAIWAMSASSLFKLEPGQKEFAAADAISQARYFDVAVEPGGIFWLATSEGLLRYAPPVWRSPPGAGELTHAPVVALAGDGSSHVIAVSSANLNVLHDREWAEFALPAGEATPDDPQPMYVLPGGLLVMEAGERLLLFNQSTGQFRYADDSSQKRVKLLGLLKDGTLCVELSDTNAPAGSAHLAAFDGMKFGDFPYPQPDLGPAGGPVSLLPSKNGDLWLVLQRGMAWFHEGNWEHLALPVQTASAVHVCLVETEGGRIWCGVQDVIHEFDGKKWTPIQAGFYGINGMIRGGDGSVWVASENGLHRFIRGGWSVNGVEEGLPSAAVREVYEDRQGRLWAGTSRGLSQYHPEADPDPPRTSVENLPGPNNSVPEGGIATFHFSGQDKWKFTPEDRLVYSYQLDGLDWSAYQEQRNATFFDLAAGKHSFRVRSRDRNWNVDPNPALLQFVVAVPWYRDSRLTFISGTGLAAVIFFAGLAYNRHRQLVKSYAEVEAKVALRTKQLEQANQELFHSQKMTALGTLAAGIAHDFNNILSIIKGSAQIIEENLDNQTKIRVRTDRIKTVVEQGAGIVRAMLGFSRGSRLQLTMCDVNAVVGETITLLGDRFLRETEVKFTPGNHAPPEVPASKDFIQQILLNFIFNAADASTGHREVILAVKESAELPAVMALKPVAAASYVFIAVKDFGSGIAPEVMPRIFEPFFTTKSLSARRGTGLGLSMAYELARQMECGLSVESTAGQGSTFTLIIPVRSLLADVIK